MNNNFFESNNGREFTEYQLPMIIRNLSRLTEAVEESNSLQYQNQQLIKNQEKDTYTTVLPSELLEQKKNFVEKIGSVNHALKVLFNGIENGEANGLDLSTLPFGNGSELEKMIESIETWSKSMSNVLPEKRERTLLDFK